MVLSPAVEMALGWCYISLKEDDADWSKVGVKEGQKLMMMGTADEIVKAPEKGPVFAEDMLEEEQVVAVGSFSWIDQSWKHLLYELHITMFAFSARALITYPPPVRSDA